MILACCWYLSQSLVSRILADFGGCHQIAGPKQIAPMKAPLKREKLTPARERALFATGWLTSHKAREGVEWNSVHFPDFRSKSVIVTHFGKKKIFYKMYVIFETI